MGKLTTNQEIKLVKRVKKAWETGEFKTRGDLAVHFGITYNQVRGMLTGRVKTAGTAAIPEGNYRKYVAYGKTLYVYDDGRVWSTTTNKFIGKNSPLGYRLVSLIDPKTGKYKNLRVSRIMLEVFVRPPEAGEWARHWDDNPRNNKLKNLVWGDAQDNADDMVRNGHSLKGVKNHNQKLTEKDVERIAKTYKGEPYKTFAKAFIEQYNVDVEVLAIVRILRGQQWQHVTGFDRATPGTIAVLNERAVRAIHKNFAKSESDYMEFSEDFAAFLNKNGYEVSPKTVYNALRGRTWPKIYAEYTGGN